MDNLVFIKITFGSALYHYSKIFKSENQERVYCFSAGLIIGNSPLCQQEKEQVADSTIAGLEKENNLTCVALTSSYQNALTAFHILPLGEELAK